MARFLDTTNYSVVETNHVAAVRTGQIKAQYPMSDALKAVGAQNGQLLVVDDVAKEVGLPADATAVAWLHASEERLYESHLGRDKFIVTDPNYPRMMKLAVGDIFETDAVSADIGAEGAFATVAAVKTDAKVGVPSATGDIELLAAAAETEGIILDIVEWVTLPNGKEGIKFAVAKA